MHGLSAKHGYMLETLSIRTVLALIGSKNLFGADNQQGSPLDLLKIDDPSETTRHAPLNERVKI